MVVTIRDNASDAHAEVVWEVDPYAEALAGSRLRRMQGHDGCAPVCTELGRRLLRAQFEMSEWVLRRVEKVRFDHDRRVSREISIDLRVPEYAPVVRFERERHWLVPISVMRRRTLVNLDLRDEVGGSISMPGLRFTQRLDVAVLRAAALLGTGGGRLSPQVDSLIVDAVCGDWHKVKAVGKKLAGSPTATEVPSFEDSPLFRASLERLLHNFTLYVLLPEKAGRHRLLRMAFDEPVDWVFQSPDLGPNESDGGYFVYRPLAKRERRLRNWKASLGLAPTRMRFLTPSAENCASYHFEFTAPLGVRISRGTLLAGRPDDAGRSTGAGDRASPITLDDLDGHGPTIGLHGVEVPNGSLSRAQVELQIPAQGWLSTLLVACVGSLLAVVYVLLHSRWAVFPSWDADQVNNVVVLLFGVTAGAATFVAYHHATEVATRMVTVLRFIGVIAISLPSIVGAGLVHLGPRAARERLGGEWEWVAVATVVSLLCVVLVGSAWLNARRDHRKQRRISVWDMSDDAVESKQEPRDVSEVPYMQLVADYGFDKPALGVYSAEGWHETYRWNDDAQKRAADLLSLPGNPTHCSCSDVVAGQPSGPIPDTSLAGEARDGRIVTRALD